MKVLNFGSLNLDYVYDVDHFVREGETISSVDMNVFCGGKGLNQSVALAKAGVKYTMPEQWEVQTELCFWRHFLMWEPIYLI